MSDMSAKIIYWHRVDVYLFSPCRKMNRHVVVNCNYRLIACIDGAAVDRLTRWISLVTVV